MAHPPSSPNRSASLVVPAVVLVITLASAFAVNPYDYGSGDNSITIPFLQASVDPGLYPGDLLIAQRPYYYTYLWDVLGWIHAHVVPSLPALFFGVYLVALYFTFLGLYRISRSLFGSREAGILALLFLLFSKLTLADVNTVESLLNTRGVAMPLLLFAIHEFLNERLTRSFALLGLAYLIHPLSTHYLLAMLVVAGLVQGRRRGFGRLGAGLATFLVVASPLLIWKFRRTPPSAHLFAADPRWVEALRVRSAYHMFPFTWGWPALAHGILVLALFAVAFWRRDREAEERHRVIGTAVLTILSLMALGTVFTEVWPLGAAFFLQPLRAFVFLEYFAALYVASFVVRAFERPGRLAGVLLPCAATLGIAEGVDRAGVVVAVLLAALACLAAFRRGRPSPDGRRLAIAMSCLAVLAAGASYLVDRSHHDRTFSIRNDQEPAWLDVARWARASTERRDGFIVPPDEESEFRVEGQRTVYADWEDGGLMNGNPAFGIEWLRRMKRLGWDPAERREPDFCRLAAPRLRGIAAEMRRDHPRVFLVWPCTDRLLPFPVRYRNDVYVVYEVAAG